MTWKHGERAGGGREEVDLGDELFAGNPRKD